MRREVRKLKGDEEREVEFVGEVAGGGSAVEVAGFGRERKVRVKVRMRVMVEVGDEAMVRVRIVGGCEAELCS